ncbi:DUF3226 domain-containing protein [Leptolyngbya sp. NIES-2104]|uniref:DUF3226 domain-containing protein n=1 Tax=Leptolyngbya sp. NIES-2104 TaxID=1552121 RepID=UPI0006EC5690|nr:DUF3226 domain-containing protein [Leptolyngbya sp. NIES-2104]GAP98385.1 hypothetical protein NIES2104_49400 [Leptolyngbya sp. NIES-2104]
MAKRLVPRKLIVEGNEDKRVIPELIEKSGIQWVEQHNPIVYIEALDGYQQLTDPVVIQAQIDTSNLQALGIVIDADDQPVSRWQSVRNAVCRSIPDIPEELPETGLVHQAQNSIGDPIRFGIWMMPDNRLQGMLETFLAHLIETEQQELWQYAQEATGIAKTKSARFKQTHTDKANLYTWLAWQAPPGRQLHQAIQEKILKPEHPTAQRFVAWFKDLYDI